MDSKKTPAVASEKAAAPLPARRKNNNRRRRRAQPARETAPQKLKLLITIVNRGKGDFYADIIQSFEVNMQMILAARGTASNEMLSYLGLGSRDKTVILSMIRDDMAETALRVLDEKFRSVRNGNGVAFTVPLTSTIGLAIYQFLINNRKTTL